MESQFCRTLPAAIHKHPIRHVILVPFQACQWLMLQVRCADVHNQYQYWYDSKAPASPSLTVTHKILFHSLKVHWIYLPPKCRYKAQIGMQQANVCIWIFCCFLQTPHSIQLKSITYTTSFPLSFCHLAQTGLFLWLDLMTCSISTQVGSPFLLLFSWFTIYP